MKPLERPFPHARQSKALQEEDAFMHAHGGWGNQRLYKLAQVPSFNLGFARRLARVLRMWFRRTPEAR